MKKIKHIEIEYIALHWCKGEVNRRVTHYQSVPPLVYKYAYKQTCENKNR